VTAIPALAIVVASAGMIALVNQELPEGPGKALVAERCAGCHDIQTAVRPRLGREGWAAVIAKEIERGARLDDRERGVAVDYLASHFPAPAADPEVERTARRLVDGICSSCHDVDLISDTRGSKTEWREIIVRMNGKGAGLSEADVDLLTDYLARKYPAN
jgi:cytochrome c5